MTVDLQPIRAFLDDAHAALLAKAHAFTKGFLAKRKPAETDVEARAEARSLLKLIGAAGLFEPIRARDYRGCCLLREELAFHSPLADAVFALQALGATPLLLGGSAEQVEFATKAIAGEAMGPYECRRCLKNAGRAR